MATKDSIVSAFAKAGTEIKGIKDLIGNLSQLNTTAKDSVVLAINELKTQLGNTPSNPSSSGTLFAPPFSLAGTGTETVVASFDLNKGNTSKYSFDYSFAGELRNSAVTTVQIRLRLRLGGLTGVVLFDSGNMTCSLATGASIRKFAFAGSLFASPNTASSQSVLYLGAVLASNSQAGATTGGTFTPWSNTFGFNWANSTTLVLTAQMNLTSSSSTFVLYNGSLVFDS